VSAVARQLTPEDPMIYIQTDAPINPGNSGGPLVNIRGEVVGINTFIVSQSGGNEGLGFAIPSATARTAVGQLRQFGQLRRQEVGMSLQTITPTMAGSLVLPADRADGTLATALSGKMSLVPAWIVGIASELDLAVLKVDGLSLPALPLATYTQVRQGQSVFAFGSPMGLRNSLTHGLVSAVARQIDADSPLIYVQTDAPINPGNSGGPLVNIKGEVVGVNTFILSQTGGSDGLGFAIPSATARTAFRQLKQYGQLRRQEIGMSIQTITPAMAQSLTLPRDYGVIVSDVWPNGPAQAAGLKVGDVLSTVDGQPADNLPTVSYQFRLRDSTDPVKLVVLRGNGQQTLSVTPVEQRNLLDSVATMGDPTRSLVSELGILGVEIDARIATSSSGLRDPWGIIVVARAAGATTEVPLQPRDVIRAVNNQYVTTLDRLRDAVRGLKPGTPVTLQVQRDSRLMYISFTME